MKLDTEKHVLNTATENGDRTTHFILLVEDEYDLGSTLSMLLELHGLRTLHVNNGQQALAAIKNHPPDLVLSDCMMPVMDGITLSHRLRSDTETAHIPIVLMSAAPQYHDLSQADFDAFIQKPFHFADLLETIMPLLTAPR